MAPTWVDSGDFPPQNLHEDVITVQTITRPASEDSWCSWLWAKEDATSSTPSQTVNVKNKDTRNAQMKNHQAEAAARRVKRICRMDTHAAAGVLEVVVTANHLVDTTTKGDAVAVPLDLAVSANVPAEITAIAGAAHSIVTLRTAQVLAIVHDVEP
ncbi:hypothetical protein diail_5149 [Diaporthe ilicicola]|nr:hypothetical protein diail_5149 [Diaporthe ilicicola]